LAQKDNFKTPKIQDMEDFVLVFRRPEAMIHQPPPADMQAVLKKWDAWFGGIKAQGKLSNTGIRLANEGKVLKQGGVVTDGPFVEIRELLNGIIVIKADDMDDAVTIAHGCPILEINGSVEVRPYIQTDQPQYFSPAAFNP
jgi:hypothetical protein